MADNENNSSAQEFKLPHRSPSDLRTTYASGVIVAGPVGALDQFMLTFYLDTSLVDSETLELEGRNPEGGARYRAVKNGVNLMPIREDVARVMVNTQTMLSLLELIALRVGKKIVDLEPKNNDAGHNAQVDHA